MNTRRRGSVKKAVLVLAGLAFLGFLSYHGARWIVRSTTPAPEGGGADEPAVLAPADDSALAANERFVVVEPHEEPVYDRFSGIVRAEGRHVVRAPLGMIVPIDRIRKEAGDLVKKGDVLLEFHEPTLRKAIDDARAAGREEDAKRFEGFLPFVKLRSEVDGVVLDIQTQEGWTPLNTDVGMGLMTIADDTSYLFHVLIPVQAVAASAFLGAELTVEIHREPGAEPIRIDGTVSAYEPTAIDGMQGVLVQLPATAGLERDLRGQVRVPVSKRVVALVPKAAVRAKGDVKLVRVWDPDTRSVSDRTIVVTGELEGSFIVEAGVFAGESVVVPRPGR